MIYLEENYLQQLAFKILETHCDKVITLQGRFKEFCWTPNTKNWQSNIFPSQMDQRNFALRKLPNCEYFLVGDSDELFFGNWNLARQILNINMPQVAWVKEFMPNDKSKPRARVIYKTDDLKYTYNHFTLENNLGIIIGHKKVSQELQKEPEERCNFPLMFLHLRDYQDPKYMCERDQYYATRQTEVKPK